MSRTCTVGIGIGSPIQGKATKIKLHEDIPWVRIYTIPNYQHSGSCGINLHLTHKISALDNNLEHITIKTELIIITK